VVQSTAYNSDQLSVLKKNIRQIISQSYALPGKIAFIDSFILTETGKINRKQTNQILNEIIDF
jgi:non-ribosomal peptide synthetase component E (peptide arylation enzyme)